MPADMVHGDQRDAERERGRLGEIHADEHGADQPGRIAYGDGVDLLARDPRLFQRALGQQRDRLDVAA